MGLLQSQSGKYGKVRSRQVEGKRLRPKNNITLDSEMHAVLAIRIR